MIKMSSTQKSSKSRSDCAVQGTNDSSIMSKCSTAKHGYFDDKFLQYFVAKIQRRAPLIHRQYFVRAAAMEYCFEKFLQHYSHSEKQILLLGAGFDSTFFRLKEKGFLHNTLMFEVDFPEVMRRKLLLIEHHGELNSCLHNKKTKDLSPNCLMSSEHLRMLGVDLTQLKLLTSSLEQAGCDFSKPTIIVSEVVLAYMKARDSTAVVHWCIATFPHAMFVLYEQIRPEDAFGVFMQRHFNNIGSTLRTLNTYPTIDDQLSRFHKANWVNVHAMNINQFYYSVLSAEQRRYVESLEPFDEFEEFHLACAHYVLLTATRGSCDVLYTAEEIENMRPSSPQGECEDHMRWELLPACDSLGMTGHTAVSLPGKRILLVGGYGNTGQGKAHGRIKDLSVFDLSTNTYHKLLTTDGTTAHMERMYHTATELDENTVLIHGGRLSPMKFPTSDSLLIHLDYNSSPNNCDSSMCEKQALSCKIEVLNCTGDEPCQRWKHTATKCFIEGVPHIVIVGGRNSESVLDSVHVLNLKERSWKKIGHMCSSVQRFSHTATLYGDRIFVVGGLGPDGCPVQENLVFDLNSLSWKTWQIPLSPRYSHAALLRGHQRNQLWLVGGVGLSIPSPGLAVVDLDTHAIQEFSLPLPAFDSELTMLHGHTVVETEDQKIYVLGGGGNCFSFGTHLNTSPVLLQHS